MNVFVLSTGRCGSTTFERACKHFTNFTCGHESRSGRLGAARLDYPKYHIESDNRLSWLLGRLDQRFGNDAYYVHLTRDPEMVAQSYIKRFNFKESIMKAYKNGILIRSEKHAPNTDKIDYARDYVETVNCNIKSFLSDKSNKMQFDLSEAEDKFPKFCDWINAKGDLAKAQAEFLIKHNASNARA